MNKVIKEEIFSCTNLSVSFEMPNAPKNQSTITVIKDLNVQVHKNEIVAIVGSSGSGKSLLAHSMLGILPDNAQSTGTMYFAGARLDHAEKKRLRGKEIVLIPQNSSFLDPSMKIGQQIAQGQYKQNKERVCSILKRYGLSPEVSNKYPFELSGGMIRRVLIATAVFQTPQLIIADEPTPGLHETLARQVLSHFRELADDGMGILLITHDLETALSVADRVIVFYAGVSIEEALVHDFDSDKTLRHPYTKALWRSLPKNGFTPTKGLQPSVHEAFTGCPFTPRCDSYTKACNNPILWIQHTGGFVRCTLYQGEV
ncbi:MAG: ATP-binding cassette domain-containing protein [Treponemataceae bacterium]